MAKQIVYCGHIWDPHGPGTVVCRLCKELWYKFKDAKPPRVVVSYIVDEEDDEED